MAFFDFLLDIGNVLSGGMLSGVQQRRTEQRQQDYSLQQMQAQAMYNRQQAQYENELNQSSLDYNMNKYNTKWQVDQMKAAGLNPSLLGANPTSANVAPQASVGGVSSSTPIASNDALAMSQAISGLADVDLKRKQGNNLDAQTDGILIDNTFKQRQNELNLNLTNVQINAQMENIKMSRQQRKESKARLLKINEDCKALSEQIKLFKDQHMKNEKDLKYYDAHWNSILAEQASQITRNKKEAALLVEQARTQMEQQGLIRANRKGQELDNQFNSDTMPYRENSVYQENRKKSKEVTTQQLTNDKISFDLGISKEYSEFEHNLGNAEKTILLITRAMNAAQTGMQLGK